MPRSTAEKIIAAANSPYYVLVGDVYPAKHPVEMTRVSAIGKTTPSKRKARSKKKGRKQISKAEFVERMRAGKAKARSRKSTMTVSELPSYESYETAPYAEIPAYEESVVESLSPEFLASTESSIKESRRQRRARLYDTDTRTREYLKKQNLV